MAIERLMYRPAEFGEAIGISRAKAYELIATGEIPSVLVGGCRRVPVDAARQWIDKKLSEQTLAGVNRASKHGLNLG
jgi:excisionase family DNA binding protein